MSHQRVEPHRQTAFDGAASVLTWRKGLIGVTSGVGRSGTGSSVAGSARGSENKLDSISAALNGMIGPL